MKPMQAGSLKHLVAIEKLTTTDRPSGGHDDVWTEVDRRRVNIRPMQGTELMEAREVVANVTHKVRMRYYAGLKSTTFRLVWGDRVFNIRSVLNVEERNREMILTCEETVT